MLTKIFNLIPKLTLLANQNKDGCLSTTWKENEIFMKEI